MNEQKWGRGLEPVKQELKWIVPTNVRTEEQHYVICVQYLQIKTTWKTFQHILTSLASLVSSILVWVQILQGLFGFINTIVSSHLQQWFYFTATHGGQAKNNIRIQLEQMCIKKQVRHFHTAIKAERPKNKMLNYLCGLI